MKFAPAAALFLLAAPALAQTSGYTLEQVERRYHGMKDVHILKCDRNHDGVYNRTEMACVSAIYEQMYLRD